MLAFWLAFGLVWLVFYLLRHHLGLVFPSPAAACGTTPSNLRLKTLDQRARIHSRFPGKLFFGRGGAGGKTAAAGLEDVKAKLGLAQNKSLDLEREASSLRKKVRSL